VDLDVLHRGTPTRTVMRRQRCGRAAVTAHTGTRATDQRDTLSDIVYTVDR